jgi:16S rRNA (guanine966-N2)-methyltransferase
MPRIIAGTARGVILETPEGPGTRPTADFRKEAVFSSIQFEIPGSRFLDLFSGSGAAGLEALSRGAAEAVLVDSDPAAAACIRRNLTKTKLAGGTVLETDIFTAMDRLCKEGKQFDIIYADPPYHRSYEGKILTMIAKNGLAASGDGTDGALVVLESASDTVFEIPDGFVKLKEKKYRVTKFTILRRKEEIDDTCVSGQL